jgi:hypothetical protein
MCRSSTRLWRTGWAAARASDRQGTPTGGSG